MKLSKKGTEKCNRLGELTLQKDAIEAEIKVLREDLDVLFNVGDVFAFTVEDQKFEFLKRLEDVAVLKSNEELFKLLGKADFIDIAKVSKTAVEKAFGKAVAIECIDHFDPTERTVLVKKK